MAIWNVLVSLVERQGTGARCPGEVERSGTGERRPCDIERSGTGIVRCSSWFALALMFVCLSVSAEQLSVDLFDDDGELLLLAEGETLVLAGAGAGVAGYHLFDVYKYDKAIENPDESGNGTSSEGSGSGGSTESEGSGSGGSTHSEGSVSGSIFWGAAEVVIHVNGLADVILYREVDGELEEYRVLVDLEL